MPDKLHITLFENPSAWPLPDDAAQDALEFCLMRLYARNLSYYTARVAGLHPVAGTRTWQGRCPFCESAYRIDALSGWSECATCGHQGDAYTLEYCLFGEHEPERWEACRVQAEALMDGPLSRALSGGQGAEAVGLLDSADHVAQVGDQSGEAVAIVPPGGLAERPSQL